MSKQYEAVVIGASSGGLAALAAIIPKLPKDFLPVIVVIHMKDDAENLLPSNLDKKSHMHVKEAQSNEPIKRGVTYISPPGYHLLVELDLTLSLSMQERVHYSRPSIDVLFESAADAYQDKLIGIVLTGANSDGSDGLKMIKEKGGLTIVQDPKTAESAYMPEAALKKTKADYVLSLEDIADFLCQLQQVAVE